MITKLALTALTGILIIFAVLLLYVQASAVGETGGISGHIFMDDDGSLCKDAPTDSNGVHDPGEWHDNGIKVRIFDGGSYQVKFSDYGGNWSATVLAGVPVTVEIDPVDINLPPGFAPTTPIIQTVTATTTATTTVPAFGYGPWDC